MKKLLELTLLLSLATLAMPVLPAAEVEEIEEEKEAQSEEEQGRERSDQEEEQGRERLDQEEEQGQEQLDDEEDESGVNQGQQEPINLDPAGNSSSFMEYIREFPGGACAWVRNHKSVVGGTTAVVVATAVAYYAWCKNANNTQEGEKCFECKDEWADFS